jgi:hypothetical protein
MIRNTSERCTGLKQTYNATCHSWSWSCVRARWGLCGASTRALLFVTMVVCQSPLMVVWHKCQSTAVCDHGRVSEPGEDCVVRVSDHWFSWPWSSVRARWGLCGASVRARSIPRATSLDSLRYIHILISLRCPLGFYTHQLCLAWCLVHGYFSCNLVYAVPWMM